ncbi:hypothetical protein V8G54_037790 [Vigna mungo]|uniref:Retrotransposon gag domain-containing protein n=1 Tax=Vigna mungo TaxID=3915 RepID=A0AAQ3RFQ2_VIGMU
MAENTHMKELAAEVNRLKDLPETMNKMVEALNVQDKEMKKLMELLATREKDHATRFETLESNLDSLLRLGGTQNTASSHLPFQVRNVKIDFPRFDGADVLQWIFKAEHFFGYYHTPDDQRLTIAAIHLDKEVVPWFQMQMRNNAFPTWIAFTRALELEYGPSPYECIRSSLFKLTQENSVQNYYVKFTTLANRVQGVTTEALLDCFVGGLKPDIRRDVLAQNPTTLLRCVSLAKLYEEKYISKPKPYHNTFSRNTPATNPNLSQSLKTTSLPPLLPSPTNITPIKKMTSAEMQLRREKGLCFTCDDKFTPSHRCPNRQYLLLQLDEEEVLPAQESTPSELTLESSVLLEPHLSYNALKGASVRVQVLFDSGSSNNFLQPRIAHCLKLPVEPIPEIKVLVGNGHALHAEGLVNNLEVKIQGNSLILPVYLLPVSGADLVLGASWLSTLGPHIADYNKLTIKFLLNNQFITLYGDYTQLPSQAHCHHLKRFHQTQAIVELYSLHFSLNTVSNDQPLDLPTNIAPDLAILLHTYKQVFSIPSGLPPSRLHNQFIPLIKGAQPVKVKPYRYPHSQKE